MPLGWPAETNPMNRPDNRLALGVLAGIYANIFLNLLHLIVWFAALWLILRFQWGHAFGLALALWLVVTFAIMPMLFKRAEDTARGINRSVAAVVRYEAVLGLIEAHHPSSSASAGR